MKVFKYEFHARTGRHEMQLPVGAVALHVAGQRDVLCLWVLCDPSADRALRLFHVAFTGESLPVGNLKFVGTGMLRGGDLVCHVFEELT